MCLVGAAMEHYHKDTKANSHHHNVSAPTHHEGPARRIALLFTDLKGSSGFYKMHGNVAGRKMIQRLNDILIPIVKTYKGIVVKTIGDSIMAYFHSPKEALWASIAMQKRLQSYNKDHKPADRLLIRVGMNYGYGIVEEKDVFGDVVNIAAKLLSCCDAQQIIVTESFYQATKSSAEIMFRPFNMLGKRQKLGNIKLYQVTWKKIGEQKDFENIYLLSLTLETTATGENTSKEIKKLIPGIRRSAYKTVQETATEINAIFHDPTTCLATAGETLQTYLQASSHDTELPHVLKIGIHAVSKTALGDGKLLDLFAEPLKACRRAQPYEIVLTSQLYNDLPSDFQQTCVPLKSRSPGQTALYLYNWEKLKKQRPIFTAIIPDEGLPADSTPCFYCGTTKHTTNSCPSKFIRKTKSFLDKLGYLPLHEIRHMYYENFADIVKPITRDSGAARFELLLKENRNDPFSVAFFAFYEITAFFQLRSLQQLYAGTAANTGSVNAKTGSLLMGADCLRVSRFEDASFWFEKARVEQINDFRPHIALGILSIENSRPEQALTHFNKALSFNITTIQKSYLHLLIARVYEGAGALQHAQDEAEWALQMWPDWNEAKYYLAVLLVKMGKTKEGIEIFKKLMQQSPRYYLMVSLNPELHSAKGAISAFLNRELISIRAHSQKSFENIRKTIENYRDWFQKNDENYTKAYELYRKASAILQEESISGLTDIPGFELSIYQALRQALDRFKRDMHSKIALLKKHLDRNTKYLDSFPYRNLLSSKDFRLNEDFKKLFEQITELYELQSPQSLQGAHRMINNLTKKTGPLTVNQKRLELLKKSYFTMECSLKVIVVFAATALTTIILFTFVLLLYQGYEYSPASITATRFVNFLKFGSYASLFAGIFACAVWLKRNFIKLQRKIES